MVQLFELETKLNGQEDITQYHDLVKELGLDGQSSVIIDDTQEPIPYMWLNSVQFNVIETLCPRRKDVAEFDKEPIPIEVLEHIKLSKKYFNHLSVYYTDVDPDPFLVGFLGGYTYIDKSFKERMIITRDNYDQFKSQSIYGEEAYAIARWGDEKRSWDELTLKAKEKYILIQSNEAKKNIKYYERQLSDVENNAFDRFGI